MAVPREARGGVPTDRRDDARPARVAAHDRRRDADVAQESGRDIRGVVFGAAGVLRWCGDQRLRQAEHLVAVDGRRHDVAAVPGLHAATLPTATLARRSAVRTMVAMDLAEALRPHLDPDPQPEP